MQYTDAIFQVLKQVKQGRTQLPAAFQPVADLILQQWQLQPLFITLEPATSPKGMALLHIYMNSWEECTVLRSAPQQALIADRLRETIPLPALYVGFDAFMPAATAAVMQRIPPAVISDLAKALDPAMWKLDWYNGAVTFFLHTEAERKEREAAGALDRWKDQLFALISDYDTEGLCERPALWATIDSKENFDTNYNSNWYYYYK